MAAALPLISHLIYTQVDQTPDRGLVATMNFENARWILTVTRACDWGVSAGGLEDGSGYWLQVGPLSVSLGYAGLAPVRPLTLAALLCAVGTWIRRGNNLR